MFVCECLSVNVCLWMFVWECLSVSGGAAPVRCRAGQNCSIAAPQRAGCRRGGGEDVSTRQCDIRRAPVAPSHAARPARSAQHLVAVRRAVAHGHLELQLRGAARGHRRRGLRARAGILSAPRGPGRHVRSGRKTPILPWTTAPQKLHARRVGFGRVVTLFGRWSTSYQIREGVRCL
jgi:hypothetical protein